MNSSQIRYSTLYKVNPQSVLNNLTVTLKIEGLLDLDLFSASIQEVIKNRSLLNSFCDLKDFKYVVIPDLNHETRINILNIPITQDHKLFVIEHAKKQNDLSFDVENESLYRISIFKQADNLHYLTLTIIHTIADGIAISYFIKDVFTQYEKALHSQDDIKLVEDDFSLYAEDEVKISHYNDKASWWGDYFSGNKLNFHEINNFSDIGHLNHHFIVLSPFSLNMFSSKLIEFLVKADSNYKLAIDQKYYVKEVLGNRPKNIQHLNCYIDLIPYVIDMSNTYTPLIDTIINNRKAVKEKKIPYWNIVESVSNSLYGHSYGLANIEINVRFLEFGPKFGDLDLTTSIVKEAVFQTGGIMSDICLIVDCFDKRNGDISLYYNKSRIQDAEIHQIFNQMITLMKDDFFIQNNINFQ